MKNITKTLKKISTLMVNSMIVFTILMAPFGSNMQSVYAAEDKDKDKDKKEECEKDKTNEDGTPGVYKPGCEFDDALADVNEKPGGGGIKGMVEQFVGIAFASAAVSSLLFSHTPRSLADCAPNQNANITLRLMQAGALAYLLGEMKAKAEFKKASKLATDATFTPKQKLAENAGDDVINERNREENNKQLEAYETLIKVYEHKVKGISAKKKLAMVAELAYLGALGTELIMTMGHKGLCQASMLRYEGARAPLLETLTGMVVATGLSVLPSCTAAVAPPLGPLSAIMSLKPLNIAKKEAQAASQAVTSELQAIADGVTTTTTMASAAAVISGGAAGAAVAVLPDTAPAELAAEIARETTIETARMALMAEEQTAWAAASAACASCPACNTVTATIATPDIANEAAPLLCCGADVASPTNGYAPVPKISIMDKKRDILIKKIPIIGSSQIEFIKPAILNTIEQYYYTKLMSEMDPAHPEITLNKLNSFYTYLNRLEEKFDDEVHNSKEFKLYKKELAGEFNEESTVVSIKNLKLSLIQDAHALDFMSILGFGAKLFLMNKLLGKFLRNKGLITPRNRMYTFGAMGAVNAAIVFFEGKKLSENKKHLEIVKAEKERFEKSHAMQTGMLVQSGGEKDGEGMVKVGEGEGANYLRLTRNQGEMACAVPAAGKSFAPAPCPQVLPPKFLSELNSSSAKGNTQVTPLLQQIPGLVATTTAGAASGDDLNRPEVFGANLAALESKRAALRSQVDRLVKDYDEMNKPAKDSKGKSADPLARTLANIQKTFKGTPIGGAAPSLGNLSDTQSIQDASDENKEDEAGESGSSTVASTPSFQFPTPATGSPGFNYGDETYEESSNPSAKSSAQSLDEFVVNTGEIADKPEANIFQLISNRYLRSYPVLLKEVTPQAEPTK